MVSKNSRRNRTMLLILGATFFSFTLYSGEIIAALVRSNLISINLEKISDDVGSKNQKMIAFLPLNDRAVLSGHFGGGHFLKMSVQ